MLERSTGADLLAYRERSRLMINQAFIDIANICNDFFAGFQVLSTSKTFDQQYQPRDGDVALNWSAGDLEALITKAKAAHVSANLNALITSLLTIQKAHQVFLENQHDHTQLRAAYIHLSEAILQFRLSVADHVQLKVNNGAAQVESRVATNQQIINAITSKIDLAQLQLLNVERSINEINDRMNSLITNRLGFTHVLKHTRIGNSHHTYQEKLACYTPEQEVEIQTVKNFNELKLNHRLCLSTAIGFYHLNIKLRTSLIAVLETNSTLPIDQKLLAIDLLQQLCDMLLEKTTLLEKKLQLQTAHFEQKANEGSPLIEQTSSSLVEMVDANKDKLAELAQYETVITTLLTLIQLNKDGEKQASELLKKLAEDITPNEIMYEVIAQLLPTHLLVFFAKQISININPTASANCLMAAIKPNKSPEDNLAVIAAMICFSDVDDAFIRQVIISHMGGLISSTALQEQNFQLLKKYYGYAHHHPVVRANILSVLAKKLPIEEACVELIACLPYAELEENQRIITLNSKPLTHFLQTHSLISATEVRKALHENLSDKPYQYQLDMLAHLFKLELQRVENNNQNYISHYNLFNHKLTKQTRANLRAMKEWFIDILEEQLNYRVTNPTERAHLIDCIQRNAFIIDYHTDFNKFHTSSRNRVDKLLRAEKKLKP